MKLLMNDKTNSLMFSSENSVFFNIVLVTKRYEVIFQN